MRNTLCDSDIEINNNDDDDVDNDDFLRVKCKKGEKYFYLNKIH